MTTPVTIDEALIGGRHARLGGYTVSFETFRQDATRMLRTGRVRC